MKSPDCRNNAVAEHIVDDVLQNYRAEPVDVFDTGNSEGEYQYLVSHRAGYERTIGHILKHFNDVKSHSVEVLEIGSFLGLVSIALSQLGFGVTASDVAEVMSSQNLQRKLTKNNVRYTSCNLRSYKLPFDDGAFDVVVMCETLEHLNFNPLPVVQEIHRVLKPGGLFYCALPNIASRGNRLKLLEGQSIHNPIADFFDQLRPQSHATIGLHWREYTAAEVTEMLLPIGFAVQEQKYVYDSVVNETWLQRILRVPKRVLRSFLCLQPVKKVLLSCLLDMEIDHTMKPTQVTLAAKVDSLPIEFHFTDVTSPG